MTDISPNEKLLETSARWSGARAALTDEARSFMVPPDRSALLDEDEFRRQVVASIPLLRSFARGLCGDATMGDDLAQDALLKAWRYRAQFALGTNLKGWLLKIARNHFYSQRRRRWREAPLDLATGVHTPAVGGNQVPSLILNDLRNALNTLSDEQREAMILVGAGGFSHRQAAEMCDVPEGTMKSRVCRARAKLTALLEHGDVDHDDEPASLAAHLILAELSTLAVARGQASNESV
jgi:RNA polymerase sigma-70 factor (ECF subfamily)